MILRVDTRIKDVLSNQKKLLVQIKRRDCMFCIGLDVSKGYANVSIIDEKRNHLNKVFQVDDSFKGHNILTEKIKWLSNFPGKHRIRIGVESTGGYESNFINLFLKLSKEYHLDIYRLNPLSVKKYSERKLHRAKTDDTSSVDIANYLNDLRDEKTLEIISPEIFGLRKLIKFTEYEIKSRVALKTQFKMILQETFPEMIQFCRDDIPQWILKLLFKYQTPKEILKANISKLTQIPYLTREKAEEILEICKESIACKIDSVTKMLIKKFCKKIIEANKDIVELKKETEKYYRKVSNDKITTIDFVSDYSAAVYIAYIVNIDRFPNVKKFIAFFGLDPRVSTSGDIDNKRRITKKGNSLVRKLLFTNVIGCLKNKNHPISRKYNALIARGIPHFSATTICMKKLLSIIYGILKTGKDFDINYEDRIKAHEQSANSIKIKKLRIKKNGSLDTKTPISKKEYRRRKKVTESYKSIVDLNAGSSITHKNYTRDS